MNSILTLDLALCIGWSKIAPRGLFSTGVYQLPKTRNQTNGVRFELFRTWLRGKIEGVQVVAYEEPLTHGRGADQIKLALGFVTILELEANARKIELMPVHLSTLKKHATGNGKALKPAMIKAAIDKWGSDEKWVLVPVTSFAKKFRPALEKFAIRGKVPSGDQVDAVWLMNLACEKLGITRSSSTIERAPPPRATEEDPFFDGELVPCAVCGCDVDRISGNCLWAHAPKDRTKWKFVCAACRSAAAKKKEKARAKAGAKKAAVLAKRNGAKGVPRKRNETEEAVAELARPASRSKDDPDQLPLFG